MTKHKTDWKVAGIAILGIAAVEITALFMGVDGVMMTIAVAAMAGIGGYLLPSPLQKK